MKSTKRPRLKVVPPISLPTTTVQANIPEGVPKDATLWAVDVMGDYRGLGVWEGDILVTWVEAPLTNFDLAVVEVGEEAYVGRYHTGPGGYVRLEEGDDGAQVFKPSEVRTAARVMHVERKGVVVRKFPLPKGAK